MGYGPNFLRSSGYLDDGDYRHNWHPRVGCRDHLGGLHPRESFLLLLFNDSLEPDATLQTEVVSGVADVPAPPDHALKAGISLSISVRASFKALRPEGVSPGWGSAITSSVSDIAA